jgi:glycosyltransferase involved in cell wall biosynthesis
VLLCGRPDLLAKPGGDTRQILSLRRHLHLELTLELEPNLTGFDLVHVFNLSRPLEPAIQAAHAKKHGLPVVCTTIYQDLREYNRLGRRGAGRLLYTLLGRSDTRLEDARALVNLLRSGSAALPVASRLARAPTLQRRLLDNCNLLVFNSSLEAEIVGDQFDISAPTEVVPVGIDPAELTEADPTPFKERYGMEGFVLSVGRIEDLKNQPNLILALKSESVPLVLVGQINPLHRRYARAVARAAARRPRTLLLHDLERSLVVSAMAAAAVHVLPSWFETVGLVSLEAAGVGCAVVSTDRGYARAYLEKDALYCDPSDPSSIRRAIKEALAQGPSSVLRQRVLSMFTEQRSARSMQQIYLKVTP